MANLLENANLEPLTNVTKKEVVSLVDLLLNEEQKEALVIKREASRASAKTTKSSRAARLTKTRSASTSAKGKAAAPIQRQEQNRKAKKKQQDEKKRLQEYQVQQGKKSLKNTGNTTLDDKKNADKSIKDARENSLVINEKLRPIIFGMLDFLPAFDAVAASSTSIGNILKINRAIKVLNTENLPDDVNVSDQQDLVLDYLPLYTQYVAQLKSFLDSLDAGNFTFLSEVLSLLEIGEESASSCSNTQLLLTILRDYALTIENCSPRLFETEEREFPEAGTILPDVPTGLTALKTVLGSTKALDYLGPVLGDDQERALKILLYQISSELKMSYNNSKYGKNYNASVLLQAPSQLRSTVPPPFRGARRSLGISQFIESSEDAQPNSFLFPFEKSDILPDDSGVIFDSAPDIIAHEQNKSSVNVYSNIAKTTKEACSGIAALLDTADLSSSYAPSVAGFILAIEKITLPLLGLLTEGRPSNRDLIEFLFLSLAASDQELLAQLMLFLSALKEELSRPAIENNLSIAGMAKVIGSLASVPTKLSTKSFDFQTSQLSTAAIPPLAAPTLKVSSFSPTPTIGAVTLSAPAISTRATVAVSANPGSELAAAVVNSAIVKATAIKAEGLVAAKVDIAIPTTETTSEYSSEYSDICDATAALLLKAFAGVKTTGKPIGGVVPLTEKTIASSLRSISTSASDNDVFITLLTLFDDFVEMFSSSSGSCFSGSNTVHSGIARGNIEIAFFMCVCKIQYFASYKAYEITTNKTDMTGADVSLDFERLVDISENLIDAFSGELDLDDLASASDSLARILQSLIDEEADIATFPATFSEYMDSVGMSFTALRASLDQDISSTSTALRERIASGLPVSSDLAIYLNAYTKLYNSDIASFDGTRMTDWAINDTSLSFFANALKDIGFSKNKKILAIGIPSGLCDAIYNIPISLEDSTREPSSLASDVFDIEVEKIDLTRPNLKFKAKTFSFPRNVKINSLYSTSNSDPSHSAGVNYTVFDEFFSSTVYNDEGLYEIDQSEEFQERISNLKNDLTLKMYVSLLYDLGFSALDHPIDEQSKANIFSKAVELHSAAGIDTASDLFLSGSNLAFDPLQRAMASFDWYNSSTNQLQLSIDFNKDPLAFSVWEYLSSIGTVSQTSSIKEALSLGCKFENIMLVHFDPYDFDIETETFGDDAAEDNRINTAMTLAEQEVGVGLETSQGVELSTFRVSIKIPGLIGDIEDE